MITLQLPEPKDEFQASLILALESLIEQIPSQEEVGRVGIFVQLPDSGWLLADGSTFTQSQHPELYRLLGGGTLPNYTSPFAGTVIGIKT